MFIKPFWINQERKSRSIGLIHPSTSSNGKSKIVLTPSTTSNLCRLCQAVDSGPVLLVGPTSAGKTTLVEYLAARCGHRCVRINNHEHTYFQEDMGSYDADSNGKYHSRKIFLFKLCEKGKERL